MSFRKKIRSENTDQFYLEKKIRSVFMKIQISFEILEKKIKSGNTDPFCLEEKKPDLKKQTSFEIL